MAEEIKWPKADVQMAPTRWVVEHYPPQVVKEHAKEFSKGAAEYRMSKLYEEDKGKEEEEEEDTDSSEEEEEEKQTDNGWSRDFLFSLGIGIMLGAFLTVALKFLRDT